MEAQLEQIREQQKETWNKFSAGWRKWDAFTMRWLKPLGDEIIQALQLRPTDAVLDIAAGTGEPGLTIAALVPAGQVVLTDLAEGMLAVARDHAAERGLGNCETVACDVSALPFDDATFDAVSCRLGFMFFPDMQLAAQEMVRVLKPGGRLATAVWGVPQLNPWITTVMSPINETMQLPAPAPGAPGIFRCGSPGFVAALLQQAGLRHVAEQRISGQLACGNAATYWTFMNEVAAPVVAAMSQADPATKDVIKARVFELIEQRSPGADAALGYEAVVVSGVK